MQCEAVRDDAVYLSTNKNTGPLVHINDRARRCRRASHATLRTTLATAAGSPRNARATMPRKRGAH
eukprot:8761358-Lingulodinium_polyedra.AAC.1